ncbi:MAG TPA: type II toxin-antitoxin system VapC family toxin [Polyangiaceae bacterium]|nr:type II toxin-antitoxin system VapC family toxin [Polyangiaceae bacterium]
MIYLDTSVALAHLLAEDRHPPDELWGSTVVSSRLLEYELWTRLHARDLAKSHGDAARALFARVALIELAPTVLARATEAFPVPVRTLDAIHLASADFLRAQRQTVVLASYDDRMLEAAELLGIPAWPPCARAPGRGALPAGPNKGSKGGR